MPEPICQHKWANGAMISAYILDSAPETAHPSDIMQLVIKPADSKQSIFYLNIEDANAIIHCLSAASAYAIERRAPVGA